jgi:iron complex outermembrane recepter protein
VKKTRISNLKYAAAPLALGLALISTPSFAQAANEEEAGEAIVVTGSRIARPDLEAPSPVTSVGSEQFDLTGTVTVETLLNELPQLIPGNTRTSNNQGGEDFSTLDLRGLGPERTLILVDGERVPASSTSGVVDIGTIPAGLIERVDVVTGGASAVYGSDAIAGVVNFILKDDYQGLELTTQYGISEKGDGSTFNVQGLLGGNFAEGRGNMTFFASYFTREAVGQNDRDLTRLASVLIYNDAGTDDFDDETSADLEDDTVRVGNHLELISAANNDYLFSPGGSGTGPWGTISNNAGNPFRGLSTNPATAPRFTGANTDCNTATPGVNVNGGTLSFNDAGQLTPSFGGGLCAYADRATGSSRYNFNPANFLVTPYRRFSLASTARYDITDNITLKTVANYTDSEQTVNLAPTPATGIVVPVTSPLIPADLAAALASRPNPLAPFVMSRRFSETGPRIGVYNSKTASLRGTLSGPLTEKFRWDATVSYGNTSATALAKGNINVTAVRQGLNGCPLGALPGCVPIDIFGPNTLTPAMLNFVRVDTKETREFEQVRAAVNIAGDLFELPAGGVAIAVGAEVRTDKGKADVDDAQRTGNIYGFNAVQSQSGAINVKEVYGEIRIPLLADQPFFQDLSVEAGIRFSDYSTIGGLTNWKAGAQWAPTDWVKLRGIYNKAARAPSVVELFQNGDQGFPAYSDPCNQVGRTAQALAICRTQAPDVDFTGFIQNNSQVQAFAFGNPNLTEEKATTWTVGTVLTPDFGLGRFSATVDYYNIEIKNLIGAFGAGFFLNACYVQNDPAACGRISRNTGTGQIDAINTATGNQGTRKTSGIDVGLNWVLPLEEIGLGSGRLRFNEVFTWVDKYLLDTTEFAGRSVGGAGGAIPEYKSTLTVGYDTDAFTAQVRWNYLSSVEEDFGLTLNPVTPALSYFDLSVSQEIGDNFQLTGIINNVLGAKPKRTPNGAFDQGGIDTTYYGPLVLGRYFSISAKAKF